VSSNIHYRIDNLERFETEFLSLVDTSVDYSDFSGNPWITKFDYFGKFNWGKFTIYQKDTLFLRPIVVLKIDGEIVKNLLSLRISYFQLWIFLANTILLTLLSIFMMFKLPLYFGLVLLLITIVQTFWWASLTGKWKQKFVSQIEKII
jgi:hypothetical protein